VKNAIGILESSDHFSDIATVRTLVLAIREHAGSSCPPVPSVPFVVFYSWSLWRKNPTLSYHICDKDN
jgi:hypothetical protein